MEHISRENGLSKEVTEGRMEGKDNEESTRMLEELRVGICGYEKKSAEWNGGVGTDGPAAKAEHLSYFMYRWPIFTDLRP